MKQHHPNEPLFLFLDFDVSEIHRFPSAIADVHRNAINGFIVRNVYSPEAIATVVDRLERGEPHMSRIPFTKSRHLERPPHVLGHAIVAAAPDLQQYFVDASQYRRDCRELFRGVPDFEARMEEIFGALSGGLPISVPAGPEPGQTYISSTGRVLPEGHGIRTHVGNSFLSLPQAWHLATTVDIGCQLSFFMTLTAPPSGGELVVYALEWEDIVQKFGDATTALKEYDATLEAEAAEYVQSFESMSFKPGPGDLLIFDGGRYYHRVAPAVGGVRRTIGGFLAYAKNRDRIYYWS